LLKKFVEIFQVLIQHYGILLPVQAPAEDWTAEDSRFEALNGEILLSSSRSVLFSGSLNLLSSGYKNQRTRNNVSCC
jgi:hypothetical protein